MTRPSLSLTIHVRDARGVNGLGDVILDTPWPCQLDRAPIGFASRPFRLNH
jgi:hypothetical protein